MLLYFMGGIVLVFVVILFAYFTIQKKLHGSEMRRIKQLREGTKEKSFSSEVIFQKLYVFYKRIPFINRYVNKIRRKLEIIHIDDEYLTRKQSAQIMTKAFAIIIPVFIVTLLLTREDPLLLTILLLFQVFLFETLMSGMVDKQDTRLLKQQIDFFAEIRHAYHDSYMVEEAIYEVSQNDELEVTRQGQKIHEILLSEDPETELEKYYDVAPNSFLKEFAGISYLTREFGDRTIDGASLYLRNLNNITEEMQLEILKREKLDYVFQSLSFIAIVPVLLLTPLRAWAVGNFPFTAQFYDGRQGLMMQIFLILITFMCYILTRTLKDNGSIKDEYKDPERVWQMRLYKHPWGNKIVKPFIPKERTREHRVIQKLLKEAASKQKIETLYVNRIGVTLITFIATIVFFVMLHRVAVDYIMNEPTANYDIMGAMSERDIRRAMDVTENDNIYIEYHRGNMDMDYVKASILESLPYDEFHAGASEDEMYEVAERIVGKLRVINSGYLRWFEMLISALVGAIGYMIPKWLLIFQKIMRKLEMENEVMQFQTIILMLMKIERVNVEMMLEWLERYANIFKEPITKCVNNYEAGAWEALEELKNDIAFPQLIRIVESLQSAAESIPISKAFDELDNERDYYKQKRQESNERLIKRKEMIGKGLGFAPLIGMFVFYLIGPLVVIGLLSMTTSFQTMGTMM